MCNLAISIQRNPSGDGEAARLLLAQYGKMVTQPDGIGALSVSGTDMIVARALEVKDYKGVFSDAMRTMAECPLVSIHTRIASVGNVSDENVHFFEHNGRYFAHNGHVSEYFQSKWNLQKQTPVVGKEVKTMSWCMTSKQLSKALHEKGDMGHHKYVDFDVAKALLDRLSTSVDTCQDCLEVIGGLSCPNHKNTMDMVMSLESLISTGHYLNIHLESDTEGKTTTQVMPSDAPSDSLQFLQALPEVLNCEALTKISKDKGFSGVALLTDKNTNKAWILASRIAKVHTDGVNWLNVYSFFPQSKFDNWSWPLGIPVLDDSDSAKEYELSPGVYEIDLAKLRAGEGDIINAFV